MTGRSRFAVRGSRTRNRVFAEFFVASRLFRFSRVRLLRRRVRSPSLTKMITSPATRRRPARADDQGGHEQPTELGAAPVRGGELGGGVLARIKNSLINVRLLLERSVAIHSFDASLFGGVATARLFIT
jgi:hypothetical protein